MWESQESSNCEMDGLPRWSAALILRPQLHKRCWSCRRSAGASDWVPELDWNCPSAEQAKRPEAHRKTHRPTQGHIWKKRAMSNREDLQQALHSDHKTDLHTRALSAASTARTHFRTAVTNVQVIQSPRLLLIERCRLEPTEACGGGPERCHKRQQNTVQFKCFYS